MMSATLKLRKTTRNAYAVTLTNAGMVVGDHVQETRANL
jgi:hypothetical protein